MKKCKSNTTTGKKCSLPQTRNSKYCRIHSKKPRSVNKILKDLEAKRKRGIYKILTGKERKLVRKHYSSQINLNFSQKKKIYDLDGNLISNSFTKLVIGDHGAYLEFDSIVDSIKTKPGQEWRKNNLYTKYEWLQTPNGTKIYKQKSKVKYANYKVGNYYVDPNTIMYK